MQHEYRQDRRTVSAADTPHCRQQADARRRPAGHSGRQLPVTFAQLVGSRHLRGRDRRGLRKDRRRFHRRQQPGHSPRRGGRQPQVP